jgi:hypothetical protein
MGMQPVVERLADGLSLSWPCVQVCCAQKTHAHAVLQCIRTWCLLTCIAGVHLLAIMQAALLLRVRHSAGLDTASLMLQDCANPGCAEVLNESLQQAQVCS